MGVGYLQDVFESWSKTRLVVGLACLQVNHPHVASLHLLCSPLQRPGQLVPQQIASLNLRPRWRGDVLLAKAHHVLLTKSLLQLTCQPTLALQLWSTLFLLLPLWRQLDPLLVQLPRRLLLPLPPIFL